MSTELTEYKENEFFSEKEMAHRLLEMLKDYQKTEFIQLVNLQGEMSKLAQAQQVFEKEYPEDENPFLISPQLSENRDRAEISWKMYKALSAFTQKVFDKYFQSSATAVGTNIIKAQLKAPKI